MSYHLTNILDFSPIFIQKIHISLLHSLLIFFKSKQNSFFGQNIELNFLEHNTKPLIFNWDALFISMFIHISFWSRKEQHKGINLKLLLHKIHNVMVHKYGYIGLGVSAFISPLLFVHSRLCFQGDIIQHSADRVSDLKVDIINNCLGTSANDFDKVMMILIKPC